VEWLDGKKTRKADSLTGGVIDSEVDTGWVRERAEKEKS